MRPIKFIITFDLCCFFDQTYCQGFDISSNTSLGHNTYNNLYLYNPQTLTLSGNFKHDKDML